MQADKQTDFTSICDYVNHDCPYKNSLEAGRSNNTNNRSLSSDSKLSGSFLGWNEYRKHKNNNVSGE
jgi:hypothetical protein